MAITSNTHEKQGTIRQYVQFALQAADVSVDFPSLTLTPGFIPLKVKVTNVADVTSHLWMKGMNTGDYIEEVAASAKTLETDDLLSVDETTGVISIDTTANPALTDGDLCIVEVWG